MDVRRVSLGADETAKVFMDYYRRREVFGLFLSSGVCGNADATMEKLNGTARLLRGKYGFRGFIHLKVIPGASDAAIEEAVSLASNVSRRAARGAAMSPVSMKNWVTLSASDFRAPRSWPRSERPAR